MPDVSEEIAKRALEIGAIKLSPEKPFLWASGTFNPIYNDNREQLGYHDNRMLITDAAEEAVKRIRESGTQPDFIAGTSTAGIAPASSLAQKLGLPLVILHKGEPFVFEEEPLMYIDGEMPAIGSTDAIASTCPWAIFNGVRRANRANVPFMYIRPEAKDHGLKKQIEGKIQPGWSVDLLDVHRGDSYLDVAKEVIERNGMRVNSTHSVDLTNRLSPVSLIGHTGIVFEDLISTGGSSVKEIAQYRALGADVDHCISIFSYGLDAAGRMFSGDAQYDKSGAKLEKPCQVHPLLTYDKLVDVAVALGRVSPANQKMLREWRRDQPNWGARHGFPQVAKK